MSCDGPQLRTPMLDREAGSNCLPTQRTLNNNSEGQPLWVLVNGFRRKVGGMSWGRADLRGPGTIYIHERLLDPRHLETVYGGFLDRPTLSGVICPSIRWLLYIQENSRIRDSGAGTMHFTQVKIFE